MSPQQVCQCEAVDCSRRLAGRLRDFVARNLSELEGGFLPGLLLPGADAGHPVRDNARVDLVYALALLHHQSVAWVGSAEVVPTIHALLPTISGPLVDGFFSYRLAETARLLGGLDALTPAAATVVEVGSASTVLANRVASGLAVRTNFLVVAARCEHERQALGLSGLAGVTDLSKRIRSLFAPASWISDDDQRPDQFDIYTPEMYVLAEAFRDTIDPGWSLGLARIISDLDPLCTPRGAVVWGRSIGALSEAMTVQLAALATLRRLPEREVWLGRAAETLAGFGAWFDRGLVNAHRHRTSDRYRGPERRLQLTFDLLGKILVAAGWLDASEHSIVETRREILWPDVDRYVHFGQGDAGAWAFRSRALSFVIPVVGGPTAEYAVAPRSPGTFEQPTSGPAVFVPTLFPSGTAALDHGEPLLPGHTGVQVIHRPCELTVTSRGWSDSTAVGGGRTVTFHVRGRLLEVTECFDAPAEFGAEAGITLAGGRHAPTIGSISGPGSLSTSTVDGIAEWQTPWGSYQVASQYAGPPSSGLGWSVGRGLVIASSDPDHPYNVALYEHLPAGVRVRAATRPSEDLEQELRGVDIFHLAWPERWAGRDPEVHRRVIQVVKASGVRIVWTMHNLVPHRDRNSEGEAIYGAWAAAADAVIHQSQSGKARAAATYSFAPGSEHRIISHGHWGDLVKRHRTHSRKEVEADEGWGQTGLRLAVVGQPRAEKHLHAAIRAARECNRPDLQFVIRTHPVHHHLATDRVRLEYGHLSAERYFRRFAAYDALLLPFDSGDMLTTGTAFDCIGAGIAAIGADWEFLRETFRGAMIPYETSHHGLLALLTSLDVATVTASARAVKALQPTYDWRRSSQATAALFFEQCGIDPACLNAVGHSGEVGGVEQ